MDAPEPSRVEGAVVTGTSAPGQTGGTVMDLQYLETLLSGYSYAVLVFSGAMAFYLFLGRADIDEFELPWVKAKLPRDSVLIVVAVFCVGSMGLGELATAEFERQSALHNASSGNEPWVAFWKEITSPSLNHAVFAHLRVETVRTLTAGGHLSGEYRPELEYSIVQSVLIWSLRLLPPLCLAELADSIWRDEGRPRPSGRALLGVAVAFVAVCLMWLGCLRVVTAPFEKVLLEIARHQL